MTEFEERLLIELSAIQLVIQDLVSRLDEVNINLENIDYDLENRE